MAEDWRLAARSRRARHARPGLGHLLLARVEAQSGGGDGAAERRGLSCQEHVCVCVCISYHNIL